MHDKAFTFQTLRPDTIIDGLFDLGMLWSNLNGHFDRVFSPRQ
ncbi:hypothetical protein ACLBPQ_29485, partial [Klebsiella pneumoniae]